MHGNKLSARAANRTVKISTTAKLCGDHRPEADVNPRVELDTI